MVKSKKTLYVVLFFLLLLVGGFLFLFYGSSFSVTSGDFNLGGSFGDCKFILPGDVCDSYTGCFYSSEDSASCINGYELVGFDVDGVVEVFPSPTLVVVSSE